MEQFCLKELHRFKMAHHCALDLGCGSEAMRNLQEKQNSSGDKAGFYFPCLCFDAQRRLWVLLSYPRCPVSSATPSLSVSSHSGAK